MRVFYLTLGCISLALGIVGIFLPLLPTTPFVLLSAYCFAKSSPRLHQWLLNNKTFGPMILQWQQDRTVSPTVKKRAILMVAATFSISILFFIEQIYIRFLLLFMAVVLIFYLSRLPTPATATISESEKT
jgi:uncharacterized membrane protein YbaN (DUF454 family)